MKFEGNKNECNKLFSRNSIVRSERSKQGTSEAENGAQQNLPGEAHHPEQRKGTMKFESMEQ